MRPIDLARQWHKEGLVSKTALATLEQRYADEDERGAMATVLVGGAAIVLAAALIAVPFLAEWEIKPTRIYLLVAGIVAAAAGASFWRTVQWKAIPESLALTAAALLLPAAGMFAFEDGTTLVGWLVALVGAGAMVLPSRTALVPIAALATLHVAFVMTATEALSDSATSWAWLGLAAVGVVGAFVAAGLPKWRERHAVTNVAAPIVLGFASAMWWGEALGDSVHMAGIGEAIVAAWQAPVVIAAFLLRARPILAGSVLVLAVDAIVFGFDIGELGVGIPMLLIVAGALVALALWSRRSDAVDV